MIKQPIAKIGRFQAHLAITVLKMQEQNMFMGLVTPECPSHINFKRCPITDKNNKSLMIILYNNDQK